MLQDVYFAEMFTEDISNGSSQQSNMIYVLDFRIEIQNLKDVDYTPEATTPEVNYF